VTGLCGLFCVCVEGKWKGGGGGGRSDPGIFLGFCMFLKVLSDKVYGVFEGWERRCCC